MNSATTPLAGIVICLLITCGVIPSNCVAQSESANHAESPSRTESHFSADRDKNNQSSTLPLQIKLAEEAVKLGFRRKELTQIVLGFKSRGETAPAQVTEEIYALNARQAEINRQQFSMSGTLRLNASEPGEFGGYIAECLNRINRAVRAENTESRRRFAGKRSIVWLDLAANGEIESVVSWPQKQDKEFGDYLHDVIWKVPKFPKIPQLKDRKIERVSISIPLSLQGASP